jgi:RecT family
MAFTDERETAVTKRDLIERGPETLEKLKLGQAVTISRQAGGVTFADAGQVLDWAKMMAVSGTHLPKYLRGNVGGCLAVTMKSIHWGMDPFEVANKSYEVNDRIGWESQLLHAVIEARASLVERLNCSYDGELVFADIEMTDEETGEKFVRQVVNLRESTRTCTVFGRFIGDSADRSYTSPLVKFIKTTGSPLWKADTDQQLFYYSSRAWARKWAPDILMGAYSREELAADPSIGREDEMRPGFAARLVGSTDRTEGHREGYAATELDQITAGAGEDKPETAPRPAPAKPALRQEPEPEANTGQGTKRAGKPAKGKAGPKAKTKDKAPGKGPTNAKEYSAYAEGWIHSIGNRDDAWARWEGERELRDELKVSVKERTLMQALINDLYPEDE